MTRSVRRTLLPVVLAAAALLAPAAAEAKPKPRSAACAAASASLRPSPLRACARARKAPKALPSVTGRRETATLKAKRRRATGAGAAWMMG